MPTDAEALRDRIGHTAINHTALNHTAVRGDDGAPLLCFHGTSKRFSRFTGLTHFGTHAAAHERLYNLARNHFFDLKKRGLDRIRPAPAGTRIVSAYLDIRKPFSIIDDTTDDAGAFVAMLASRMGEDGVIPERVADAYVARRSAPDLAALIGLLKTQGFDGFTYTNTWEDRGSTSWVVFDPDVQVHQVDSLKHAWDQQGRITAGSAEDFAVPLEQAEDAAPTP